MGLSWLIWTQRWPFWTPSSQIVLWDFDQSRGINDAGTSWPRDVINSHQWRRVDIDVNLHQWRRVDIWAKLGHCCCWCCCCSIYSSSNNNNDNDRIWPKCQPDVIDVNSHFTLISTRPHQCELMTSQSHDVPASLIPRDWSNRDKRALTAR